VATILIVDDERPLRRVLATLLTEHGHHVIEASSGEEAIEVAGHSQPDLVILDLTLPGINGIETMQRLRDRNPDPAFVLITAYGSIRSAVVAMQAGAFEYVTKPFDNDELLLIISRALNLRQLTAEVVSLRHELATRYGFSDLVGVGAAMREVYRVMERVATNDVTVLVLGESGTGKELVARGIHQRSRRSSGPFIAVNCSAIPNSLVEAEFFGHDRGAFTDAKESRPGTFEQAHGGTLFLDEVGDLALEAQAKLLRVLEDRRVTRLGAQKTMTVDIRVIAATNKNLESAVKKGLFREDLFWRLNVVGLRLPPLRERLEDLELLIDALLERINTELHCQVTAISNEARGLMLAYHWPGNVRELENALRQALALSQGTTLLAVDLPQRLRPVADRPHNELTGAGDPITLAAAVEQATQRIERALILATLAEHQGNRTATAQALNVNRKTLFTKMRQYGLTVDDLEPGGVDASDQ
jgi:DNA-binding NtrC family response regulator